MNRNLSTQRAERPRLQRAAFAAIMTQMGHKSTVADAVALAARVHRDQRDKSGQPYILHPLRVMLRQHDEQAQIVAVLHDVLEDSPDDCKVTAADLRADGYSEDIVTALEALTKQKDEDYDDFVERVAPNPLARRVKLADLEDNMDVRRLTKMCCEDLARIKKYHAAWRRLARLEGMLPEPDAA